MAVQNPEPNDDVSRTTRIMNRLHDSVVSKLKELHPSQPILPHHSATIERRLRELFPAFRTPTHPPYALMIRNAIIGLEEAIGSTEEAISEFVKREYNDLPWAHARILSLQLEKLCEIGELSRVEEGRYVLSAEDEVREQCQGGGKKKKKGKRKSKRGQGVSRVEESEEGLLQMVGKLQTQQQKEQEAHKGLGESQNQDSSLHLETSCSSQPSASKCLPAAEIGLLSSQLQLQLQLQLQIPCNKSSENSLDVAAKTSGSLSLNVEECKQDDNQVPVHPDHQYSGRKPRKCKQIENHQGELLLPSGDATVIEQVPSEKKIDEQCLSQLKGRGKSKGRGKLPRNARYNNKKIHPHDQTEDLVCSSHSNKKETYSSSQPAAPNSSVNPIHDFEQQLVVPTSEGSPEGLVSTGIELPQTQLQQQVSSDINLGILSKRKASSALENVRDDQLQDYNQESSKGNLNEDPMSRDSEQKPPKRPRGRPRKLETVANYPGESFLPLEYDIHDEQRPNINKSEKPHRYGRGRGGVKLGQVKITGGKRLGRPPKLNQNDKQGEEQLQQIDQEKPCGQGRGRGRSSGRGRGRPPKLKQNFFDYQEQLQQDQAQQHGEVRGQGRQPKLNGRLIKYEDQPQEDQAQLHGQVRGQGKPPTLNGNLIEYEEQPQQDKVQYVQVRGRGRSPKLVQNTNNCESQSPQEVQPKQQHVRRRGRGRPPKPNQNTTSQREEQLEFEDQDQGLVNSPGSGRNDNRNLEQKLLKEQSLGKQSLKQG
ncbi:hypothetical protein VNO78_12060 [Psophocarpus tetragonolobus]|uniref:H15 domain-containing protein n=1 Tax=Psophocarpus tetragonolobus TaxID=3891 RepID=A0AAN9SNA5_PSOTE